MILFKTESYNGWKEKGLRILIFKSRKARKNTANPQGNKDCLSYSPGGKKGGGNVPTCVEFQQPPHEFHDLCDESNLSNPPLIFYNVTSTKTTAFIHSLHILPRNYQNSKTCHWEWSTKIWRQSRKLHGSVPNSPQEWIINRDSSAISDTCWVTPTISYII